MKLVLILYSLALGRGSFIFSLSARFQYLCILKNKRIENSKICLVQTFPVTQWPLNVTSSTCVVLCITKLSLRVSWRHQGLGWITGLLWDSASWQRHFLLQDHVHFGYYWLTWCSCNTEAFIRSYPMSFTLFSSRFFLCILLESSSGHSKNSMYVCISFSIHSSILLHIHTDTPITEGVISQICQTLDHCEKCLGIVRQPTKNICVKGLKWW